MDSRCLRSSRIFLLELLLEHQVGSQPPDQARAVLRVAGRQLAGERARVLLDLAQLREQGSLHHHGAAK